MNRTFHHSVRRIRDSILREAPGQIISPEVTAPVTPEVTPEVGRMLRGVRNEMTRMEIMGVLGLRDEKHFREHYQQAALAAGLLEMTIPDKPKSRLQKYRLTEKGRAWISQNQP